MYSNSSILLLDDVLSAVDASTASRMISRCLQGPLCRNRSIVIVSHAVSSLAPLAAFACYLREGRVVFKGTGRDLMNSELLQDSPSRGGSETDLASSRATLVDPDDKSPDRSAIKALLQRSSVTKLIQDESQSRGSASWAIWRDFLARNGSYIFWSLVVMFELVVAAGPLLQRSALK